MWKMITTDATSVDGQPLVVVCLRLVRIDPAGGADVPVGPEETATAPKKRPHGKKVALGAVMLEGGTAAQEVEAIDKGIMVRGRGFLDGWLEVCNEMFPNFTPVNIPDSKNLDWDRINKGTAMSDASNQAQKMSGLIVDKVKERFIEKLGAEAWEALSEDEKKEAVLVVRAYCHNHLRCTCVRHAVVKEQAHMKEALDECLTGFKESDRMTTNVEMVVRASCKEFCHSASRLYAKGKGMLFFAFCLQFYPLIVIFVLGRADLGQRHDSSTENAVALWMNRKVYMHFLQLRISAGGDNKLEICLFALLGCLEIIAAIRCRAI